MDGKRALIVGGGHNGLVCAAYLARSGLRVTVLERRPLIGGACVTEELWPGFRISRAAYVVSLLRPRIVRELDLLRFGLEFLPRVPSSITLLPDGRSLVLGGGLAADVEEVRRFSTHDAERLPAYEALLTRVASAIEPLFDHPPPAWLPLSRADLRAALAAARAGLSLGGRLGSAIRLMTASARDLLDGWFESEPLRSTLATDAVIGAWAGPGTRGTGAVLFHHVMGSVTGQRGVWAYVRGGMGELARALADSVRAAGGEIRTEAHVSSIRVSRGRAVGVDLEGGESVDADVVVSNADPRCTFSDLVGESELPARFVRALGRIDYRSPVLKLNLALDGLPPFRFQDGTSPPPLSGTVHVGCTDLGAHDRAYDDARAGQVSTRPMVELTLPSVIDPSLAPPGKHVASIFAQYGPAAPADDPRWPRWKQEARDRILETIEEVAPGFTERILHSELLATPDLEEIFSLSGGNIFHGAMRPERLFVLRPVPGWARYRTPIRSLYLCGAGTHPGGGVMGACGRNAAQAVASDLRVD